MKRGEETRNAEFRSKNGTSQPAVAEGQSWKEKLSAIHYISESGVEGNVYVITPFRMLTTVSFIYVLRQA